MRSLLPPIILMLSFFLAASKPVPAYYWTPESKVWLGRSCVGEAGMRAHDECMAIAWTYATRSTETGMHFLRLVKKYSAAIKQHGNHQRRWIFELDLKGTKPDHWPRGLKWQVYKYQWTKLLRKLDSWARGSVPNPVPCANHFGGPMDAPQVHWIRIQTPYTRSFKNRFYRAVRAVQDKPASSALTCSSVMNGKR